MKKRIIEYLLSILEARVGSNILSEGSAEQIDLLLKKPDMDQIFAQYHTQHNNPPAINAFAASKDPVISMLYKETERQFHNTITALSVTFNELKDVRTIPDEKPNENWINRWFGNIRYITAPPLLFLWGSLLAKEIQKPGTFSPRTLAFVKDLSADDAKMLEKVLKQALYSADDHEQCYPFLVRAVSNLSDPRAQDHFQRLVEMNIINPATQITFPDTTLNFVHSESRLAVTKAQADNGLYCYPLTYIANELLVVFYRTNSDEDYALVLGNLITHLQKNEFMVTSTIPSLGNPKE